MKAVLLFLGGVGFQEILLIGLFVLVFFGAKKIPELAKTLGKAKGEFEKGKIEAEKELKDFKDKESKSD